MRILIVENDVDTREKLRAVLGSEGHQVAVACNSQEGWDAFQKNPFPVVISGWLTPGTGGVELCRRIRASDTIHYCYVILLTPPAERSRYVEAMRAGADDVLLKPYEADELRASLVAAERIAALHGRSNRLEGLLPTCMYCKKIRDERNHWVHIEEYISQRTEASF